MGLGVGLPSRSVLVVSSGFLGRWLSGRLILCSWYGILLHISGAVRLAGGTFRLCFCVVLRCDSGEVLFWLVVC